MQISSIRFLYQYYRFLDSNRYFFINFDTISEPSDDIQYYRMKHEYVIYIGYFQFMTSPTQT